MDLGPNAFLSIDNTASKLHSNAIRRLIARGMGKIPHKVHSYTPFLELVNSEAHILCSDVDITKNNLAYGRWALPKLKKELLSNDPLTSKKALMSLLDLAKDPQEAVEVIRLQFIPRLVRLMVSKDAFVRQRVLMILEALAMQPGGKIAITNNGSVMNNLLLNLSDPDSNVRLSAAMTVNSLANWYVAVEEMIKQYFVSTIINRLEEEMEENIMIVLLETLELLLDQDLAAKKLALDNNGIELAVLLEHPSAEIRALAGAVLAQLAQHPQGKDAVISHRANILQIVSQLLSDEEVAVKTQAAAVIMFTLVKTEAKKHILNRPTLELLIYNAETSLHYFPLQVNVFKVLTLLAECSAGRKVLKENLERLTDIRCANSLARKHKDRLISVVTHVV